MENWIFSFFNLQLFILLNFSKASLPNRNFTVFSLVVRLCKKTLFSVLQSIFRCWYIAGTSQRDHSIDGKTIPDCQSFCYSCPLWDPWSRPFYCCAQQVSIIIIITMPSIIFHKIISDPIGGKVYNRTGSPTIDIWNRIPYPLFCSKQERITLLSSIHEFCPITARK